MPDAPASELQVAIESLRKSTDLWPWYWYSFGEKCYASAVVAATSLNENEPLPPPGSELEQDLERGEGLYGSNGTEMMIMDYIASYEKQGDQAICSFIAKAHAHFLQPDTD